MSSTHAAPSQHTSSRNISRGTRRRLSTGRTRRLSGLEVFILVLIVIGLAYGVVASASRPMVVTSQTRIHVETGDSLWAIAQSHPVVGRTTAQVAETIARLNGLDGSRLAAGQSLVVPSLEGDVSLASR
jgi:hypothetical protein